MVCQFTFVSWRLPRYDEWGTGWRIVVDASQPSNQPDRGHLRFGHP
jgi:hypothetical protein